jgi:hypothetical protein
MAVSMVPMRDRHARLLELLPKHKYKVAPAAREAGFSAITADKQGKSLLLTALKKQEIAMQQMQKESADKLRNGDITTVEATKQLKETIGSKIGMTRDEIRENIRWLATQERDLATRLKVMRAIARDEGIDLGEEESQKVTVPVLNVTVKEKPTAIQSHIIDQSQEDGHNMHSATH